MPLASWLQNRGHEVKVVTAFPNYPGGKVYPGYKLKFRQWEEMEGVRVLRVPLYPSHNSSAVGRIANYTSFALSASTIGVALSGSADVAFVYHPPPTVGLAALAAKWMRGIPFVYHIADMWPESAAESGMLGHGWKKKAVSRVLDGWCRSVYRQAKYISVLSPGFKRLLVERGVDAAKIEIIYNWTTDSVFKPLPCDSALKQQLGLDGKFVVLYAGNVGAYQALDTLLEAAALLRETPEFQFVIAGSGQKLDSLRAQAAEMKLGNVHFLGGRPYWEMPALNSIADVLLVSLRDLPVFRATIPSKTQVSLASGRPLLMAVAGDAADVVTRYRAGLVCEPENAGAMADAVVKLYRMSPEEREIMGRNAREGYVREMSLDVGGALTEALLMKCCSRAANQRTRAAVVE
ncbi:MAG: glycosyltransferase family 4 protein [Terriglobales bacterium]